MSQTSTRTKKSTDPPVHTPFLVFPLPTGPKTLFAKPSKSRSALLIWAPLSQKAISQRVALVITLSLWQCAMRYPERSSPHMLARTLVDPLLRGGIHCDSQQHSLYGDEDEELIPYFVGCSDNPMLYCGRCLYASIWNALYCAVRRGGTALYHQQLGTKKHYPVQERLSATRQSPDDSGSCIGLHWNTPRTFQKNGRILRLGTSITTNALFLAA